MKQAILAILTTTAMVAGAATVDLPQTIQSYEAVAKQTAPGAYLFQLRGNYVLGSGQELDNLEVGFVEPGNDKSYLLVENVDGKPTAVGTLPFVPPPPQGGIVPINQPPYVAPAEASYLHPELKNWDLRPEWIDTAVASSHLNFVGYSVVEVSTAVRLKLNRNVGQQLQKTLVVPDDTPVAYIWNTLGAPPMGIGHAPYIVIDASTGAVLTSGTFPVYPPRPRPPGAVHSGG